MKPHDEWNSTDIADNARRAMQMETVDYGDEPKPLDLTRTRLFIALQLVCIVAILVALVYSAGRIF